MSIDVLQSPSGRVAVVRLIGQHDVTSASELRRVLHNHADHSELVVVDFAACTFLDSTVLGVCVGAYKRMRARGAQLIGINATGNVRRVLHITKLDVLFQSTRDVVHEDPDVSALLSPASPIEKPHTE